MFVYIYIYIQDQYTTIHWCTHQSFIEAVSALTSLPSELHATRHVLDGLVALMCRGWE